MPRYARLPDISPARLDLDVYRGDRLVVLVRLRSHGLPVSFVDVDTDGSGVVLWSFLLQIRDAPGGGLVVPEDGVEIEVVSVREGLLRLNFYEELTQVLPELSVWDLQVTDPVGRVRTVLRGSLSVVDDVTVVGRVR